MSLLLFTATLGRLPFDVFVSLFVPFVSSSFAVWSLFVSLSGSVLGVFLGVCILGDLSPYLGLLCVFTLCVLFSSFFDPVTSFHFLVSICSLQFHVCDFPRRVILSSCHFSILSFCHIVESSCCHFYQIWFWYLSMLCLLFTMPILLLCCLYCLFPWFRCVPLFFVRWSLFFHVSVSGCVCVRVRDAVMCDRVATLCEELERERVRDDNLYCQ